MWQYHSTSTSSRTYPSCPWNHKQDGCVLETGWPKVNKFTPRACCFLIWLPPLSSLSILETRFFNACHHICCCFFYYCISPDSNTAKLKLPARAPSMLPLRTAGGDCRFGYAQDSINFWRIHCLSFTSLAVVGAALTLANKRVLPSATSASPLSALAQCGQRWSRSSRAKHWRPRRRTSKSSNPNQLRHVSLQICHTLKL